jgi:tRNA(Ile)-lysidine synthase
MKLIVAVSGGIDSVVLLHMLHRRGKDELVVAHVDHGIRDDSSEDEKLVRQLAVDYGLAYESTRLGLGADASEEDAREKRYSWLRGIQRKHHATAIATAHHQDDVIETMIINLIRGTGWRGLSSLSEHDETKRQLFSWSKAEIVNYALEHELQWRDDSTNDDVKYLRNYVRYRYVQRMSVGERKRWLLINEKQRQIREKIDNELHALRGSIGNDNQYSRYWLIMSGRVAVLEVLPYVVGTRLERPVLLQLWHFVCTGKPGKQFIVSGLEFRVTARHLIVSTSDIC